MITNNDLRRIRKFKQSIRRKPKIEKMNPSMVKKLFDSYIEITKVIEVNNEILADDNLKNEKIIRQINPLPEITENLAAYAWYNYHGTVLTWGITGGDLKLCDNSLTRIQNRRIKCRTLAQIEVKAFSSNGPISYGPTEKWNIILYVDLRSVKKTGILEVYQLNEPNTSVLFQNLPVKKSSDKEMGTFREQAEKGRRPRLSFKPTKEYFRKQMFRIFSGSIEELLSHGPQ